MKRKTKDTLGNYAGLALAVGTALTGLGASIPTIPKAVLTTGIILATLGGAVMGWLTGKATTP
jgi:hypothetical protein